MCSGHRNEDDYNQMITEIILKPDALRDTVNVCYVIMYLAFIALAIELTVYYLKSLVNSRIFKLMQRQIIARFLHCQMAFCRLFSKCFA